MAVTDDRVPAGSSPTGEAGYGPAALAAAEGLAPESSQLGDVWRRFRHNRLALVGMGVVAVEVLAAALAPLITFSNPTTNNTTLGPTGPSLTHWFGTDLLGRDIYARVVYGARVSLKVGILALVIALVIGLVVGALAGFYGGVLDGLLMRITDVFLAFPYIVAAIVLIVVIGRGLNTVILVLGLLGWMPFARLFRSSILQIKELEYIEAARAVGCSDARIIVRHMLPNAIQPVVVYGTIFVGTAVLSEAALSFLGVGALEPTPAWGLMVAQGKSFMSTIPGMLFFPGAAIFLTVMAFVFMGDGLRDALDPKLR
ncbi:MAG: transporter permease [Acidimicrobiales bacterium]|jgi:peptide/nickel transport system permease protein|nr:transporter permease [Acidimicrobiales bacterium]